jgi:hypothetical protein
MPHRGRRPAVGCRRGPQHFGRPLLVETDKLVGGRDGGSRRHSCRKLRRRFCRGTGFCWGTGFCRACFLARRGCGFVLGRRRTPMDDYRSRRGSGSRHRRGRRGWGLFRAGSKHRYQACQRGAPEQSPNTLAMVAHRFHVISHDRAYLASGMVNEWLTSTLPDCPQALPVVGGLVVRGRARRRDNGRCGIPPGSTQKQQQRHGQDDDQHHQLEIVDIGDHRRLAGHFGVERRDPARAG